MSPVASHDRQVLAPLRPAMIGDGAIVAADFWPTAQASQLLPTPAGADQGQIVVGVDPIARRLTLPSTQNRVSFSPSDYIT